MKHRLTCCVSSGVTAYIYAVFIKYTPDIQKITRELLFVSD